MFREFGDALKMSCQHILKHTAWAQAAGERVGMLKLIFRFDTLELLGIHCFSDQASEFVHIGQAPCASLAQPIK